MLTQSALKEIAHYDPIVGVFIKKTKAYQAPIGYICKSIDSKGYVRIGLKGKRYLAHRLAWFYMTGEWPSDEIDHINGIRTDNAFSNLRLADRFQNKRNTKTHRDNKSGFKGVSWHVCSRKWRSRIYVEGKELNLGLYDTPEEANAAYERAAKERFGKFARAS